MKQRQSIDPKSKVTGAVANTAKARLFPLEHSPGRMLHRADMAMRSGLLRHLRESGFDLSVEEWVVLSSVLQYGEMTQQELGDRVGKDRHFLSRLLHSLETRGLLERQGTKADRRIKRIRLTAAGDKAKALLSKRLSGYLNDVFRSVSQRQYDAFIHCLEAIISWHAEQCAKGVAEPLPPLLHSSAEVVFALKRGRGPARGTQTGSSEAEEDSGQRIRLRKR